MVEEFEDGYPPIENIADAIRNIPPQAPPLIEGVLRKGHKMLVAGPSKAGKSFLLIELATCIAEGWEWLGFQCSKGKVLYVNLEVDPASCIHRFLDVQEAISQEIGISTRGSNLDVLNLRGHTLPLDKLTPKLIRKCKFKSYDAIIIDPIYKVLTGRENNAYDMAKFCNYFDQISTELCCAVIYCHHHSKGDQSWKSSMDRASGSGVFARDPDALLDVTELELPPERQRDGVTAWRVTGTLREFKSFDPVDIWFNYPIHTVEHFDSKEVAPHHELEPWRRAMNARKPKEKKQKERNSRLEAAVDICSANGDTPTITTLADYLGVSKQSVRNMVDAHDGFTRENGVVSRVKR